jgi:hypothetical protein
VSGWHPCRDEAQFIGEVMAIDAGLTGEVTNLLRKGVPLREVRATLESAVKIVRLARGAPS